MDRSDKYGIPCIEKPHQGHISRQQRGITLSAFPWSNLTLAVPTEAMRSVEAWNVFDPLGAYSETETKTSRAPEVLPNGRLVGGGINLLVSYDLPDMEYSVERDIENFFEKTSATRTACDDYAKQHVGGDVIPVVVQGLDI
ncbi:predicted protein [Histoplasma capsulatum var. duboisii H88]|uniref:Predicted protein n=1 Tax=Ajellomyces capsulatus (strain H88) TaxID=544711 RepID=F0U762_AJEC8|nr:predicted protein [Histoplasma capsulatum var. duboisii H88]